MGHTSRWHLHVQAAWWRPLMQLGLYIDRLGLPWPVAPRFTKVIPTTLSIKPSQIRLVFYTPKDYARNPKKLYPVLVNFHGGGFTIGGPQDDARWATAVTQQADTIVCSVDYRLAPRHPWPAGVEDGVDAVMYLWDNAEELGIDRDRIGVCGFSAGGNLAFTVPMLLHDVWLRRRGEGEAEEMPTTSTDGGASDAASLVKRRSEESARVVKIVISWYPKTDFTQRPLPTKWPHKELPKFFVKLFDDSYLYPLDDLPLDSPYLSPGVASDDMLELLPEHVLLYTCEWDALHAEGERLRERLKKVRDVKGKTILGVEHAWDKMPSPFRRDPLVTEVYAEACRDIKRVFYSGDRTPDSKYVTEEDLIDLDVLES